jgi:threonine dehydrogenase-like Zn-dependent dehydrogenase
MTYSSDVQGYKIQAAVLRKKGGPLKIESLEMEGPRDDEVLVRLVASGICHTDIDFIEDWDETDNAVVLGHEGAGVVERVGEKVKRVRRGDCQAWRHHQTRTEDQRGFPLKTTLDKLFGLSYQLSKNGFKSGNQREASL